MRMTWSRCLASLLLLPAACWPLVALESGYGDYRPAAYFAPLPKIGLYAAGGYQPVVMPLDDVDYLDTGGGWAVTVGYSPDTFDSIEGVLGLEFGFARSIHRNPSVGSDADYKRLLIGFRWWENSRPRVMPYLTAGISFHDIDDPVGPDVSGWGFYGGFGVDFFAGGYVAVGFDVRVHVWGGEDSFGMVTYGITPVVGVGMSAHF